MKWIGLFVCVFIVSAATAQFPQSWVGEWKGELLWYRNGAKEPEKIKMQLNIQAADSAGYTWHIIYGESSKDSRPYLLLPKNAVKGHWVIDERNGIVLDQYYFANRFTGAFTVMQSTIINSCYLENKRMHIEFSMISAKPVNSSGTGTEQSPVVNSYEVKSYQKAVLSRER